METYIDFKAPVLRLLRAKTASVKGTVLVLPGGGYRNEKLNEGLIVARFLNKQGFDAAVLEYHIGQTPETRDSALVDALKAFKMLKQSRTSFGLRGSRIDIIGLSSGGHLAARVVQRLERKRAAG